MDAPAIEAASANVSTDLDAASRAVMVPARQHAAPGALDGIVRLKALQDSGWSLGQNQMDRAVTGIMSTRKTV
jgi:hypothetical protein